MLKTRILRCLDIADGRAVKGVNLVDPVFVDPVNAACARETTGLHRNNMLGRACLAVIMAFHAPSIGTALRQVATAPLKDTT